MLDLSHYSDEEIMDTLEKEQIVIVSFSDEQIEALEKYVKDIFCKSNTFVDVTETDSDESTEEEYEAIEEESNDKDHDYMKNNRNNLERMLIKEREKSKAKT